MQKEKPSFQVIPNCAGTDWNESKSVIASGQNTGAFTLNAPP
jgi:hypothetical protein